MPLQANKKESATQKAMDLYWSRASFKTINLIILLNEKGMTLKGWERPLEPCLFKHNDL